VPVPPACFPELLLKFQSRPQQQTRSTQDWM
jgi:hypothetical protein